MACRSREALTNGLGFLFYRIIIIMKIILTVVKKKMEG